MPWYFLESVPLFCGRKEAGWETSPKLSGLYLRILFSNGNVLTELDVSLIASGCGIDVFHQ
jgi:hypothetical protein